MSLSEISLIGCRISIISKAKIRYEGYLHSVDCDTPNEPVITLSKVWSFGTEDRPCERPVAPRNEEYDQVVFRGRDLEDVRLVQSSVFLNEDSAIVSAAPGSSLTTLPGPEKPREDARVNDFKVSVSSPNSEIAGLPAQSVALKNLGHELSRPNFDIQGPPAPSRLGPVGTIKPDPSQADTRGPRPFGDGRSDGDTGTVSSVNKLNSWLNPPVNLKDGNLQRSALGSNSRADLSQSLVNRDSHRRGAVRGNSSPFYSGGPTSDHFPRRRGAFDNMWLGSNRGPRSHQGGHFRRGSRPGSHGDWFRMHTGVPPKALRSESFSVAYDYEKANAELAAELEKISLSASKSGSVDGDGSKGEENGGSTSTEEAASYDQTKSFFDTLSSEMMDKANGVAPHGMNRRDERLLNSATFGTVPYQGPRRGGYYSRSGGGAYGNFIYGQRRASVGSFWRSSGNNTSRIHYNPGPALPASGSAN